MLCGGGRAWWGKGGLCVSSDFKMLLVKKSVLSFDLTILYPIFEVLFCLQLESLYVIPALGIVLLCVFCEICLCISGVTYSVSCDIKFRVL